MARLTFVRSKRGKYYWHFTAKNGRILADSGEDYSSLAKAKVGFRSLRKSLYDLSYEVVVKK